MQKGGDILLHIPLISAPKLIDELNLFDSKKFESVWVDCQSNFNGASKERMPTNLCYNPSNEFYGVS